MPDLILHHYPTSPFSEKVRLVLGRKVEAADYGVGGIQRVNPPRPPIPDASFATAAGPPWRGRRSA